MTQNAEAAGEKYEFQKLDNPGEARLSWKAERSRRQTAINDLRKKSEKARLAQRPLDARALSEQAELLGQELLVFDDTYRQNLRTSLISEYERRDEILAGYETRLTELDRQALEALQNAYAALYSRMLAAVDYAATRNRIRASAVKYNLEVEISEYKPATAFGRVIPTSNAQEAARAAFLEYAAHLAAIPNPGNVKLDDFKHRKV